MAKGKDSVKKYMLPVIMLVTLMAMVLVATYTISPLKAMAAEGDLVIEETYPKDGANNAAVENLGVKITFNKPVNDPANHEANSGCFKITGPDGELPLKVYYNEKQPEQILVLYDVTTGGQLMSRSSDTFTVDISGDFKDNDGNTLGKDTKITFSTINQSRNTKIYMVMMFAMIIGMAVFTSMQARKRTEEKMNKDKRPKKDEPFNPYKEAKKTGRPVADIIADHEKEMAKKAKEKEEWDDDWADEEEEDNGNYKVKMPRPISYYGSKYAEKRKVEIEQKRLEAEARAPKKNKGKKKKK